jgi:hypothetical protein
MSLENTYTIDAAGVENQSGLTVLTIADSWDWNDVQSHLLALQDKLNAYFQFIESGQIWESYPTARGRKIAIDIVGRFPVPPTVEEFLEKAEQAAALLDVIIRHRCVGPATYDNPRDEESNPR